MIRFFRGTVELKLTGVSLEACLNRWTKAEISFWDLRRDGDFTARCCICERETEQAEAEANRAQMELQVLAYHGLPNLMRKFALRRVLLFGTLIAVGLAMFAQNFVWFLSVSGTESVPDSVILQALAEEGVKFGAWGPDINSEDLKNRVLNRIPALRWLAVNREGGVVTVLAAERNPEEPVEEHSGVTNVVCHLRVVLLGNVAQGVSDGEGLVRFRQLGLPAGSPAILGVKAGIFGQLVIQLDDHCFAEINVHLEMPPYSSPGTSSRTVFISSSERTSFSICSMSSRSSRSSSIKGITARTLS